MNLTQSYGTGGSTNSSQSIGHTAGIQASATAQQQAAVANSSAQSAWREAAQYNAEQARIQREWQERMANTVYQRTVEDMKKAGINPVLAAGMGLGTASVSGGSAASISPSQVFNAQTFPESNSAMESHGNSWNNSESGLITFANALTTLGNTLAQGIQSGREVNIAIQGLENIFGNPDKNNDGKVFDDSMNGLADVMKGNRTVFDYIKSELSPTNSPFFRTIKNTNNIINWGRNYNK